MKVIYIISPVLALLITYILIPVFRRLALIIQLVDKPNKRKVHQTPVPLIGGISIFIASTLALLLAIPFEIDVFKFKNIFIATFILLIIGIVDDRYDLRASFKLAIQLVLSHFVFVKGIRIESLHGLFGIYNLDPWAQYTLTMIVIAGVVNAFNLMDGIDGLAAGMAIFGFLVFSILSYISNQTLMTLVFLTLTGSLIAFLRFNLSKKQKIFMGDAGSIVLGFILVISGIKLLQGSQNNEFNSWVTFGVIAVLFVPVIDALRVFRRRAKSGESPFHADKTHLHHLVLSAGLKHKTATIAILILVTLLMSIGFISFNLIGITFSIVTMLFIFYFVTSVLQFNNKLKKWKDRIHEMENKH